jgi:hypothetical protein
VTTPNPASSEPMRGKPNGRSPKPTATAVGGLFFPQSKSLGLDRSDYSPSAGDKIIYAGVTNGSFSTASEGLAKLACLDVSAKQVERVTKRIGLERCTERDEAVAAYQALPLVQRKEAPQGVTPPAVAVVGTDGGRIQILDRSAKAAAAKLAVDLSASSTAAVEPLPAAAVFEPRAAAAVQTRASSTAAVEPLAVAAVEPAAVPPAAAAAAVNGAPAAAAPDEKRGRHWREDKVGLLMVMTSDESPSDPCPEIPEGFLDPTRMGKLVRELGKGVPVTEEPAGEAADPAAEEEALRSRPEPWHPPQMQEKRLLATRQSWEAFGPMVAQAAWALGLFAAARRAFLGDGAENNWTVWRRFFSSFVPILDFIHALSYVYAAAHAGRGRAEGWKCYALWIRWVWQGQVRQVIAALGERQAEIGQPQEGDKETHPRQVVAMALTYLENNHGRMKYDEYRRQGLPITSSYVESAVKQFNQRAKGTEKFWGEEGAEAILQLRGDYLSGDEPLEKFWERRQNQATGQRPYRRVA